MDSANEHTVIRAVEAQGTYVPFQLQASEPQQPDHLTLAKALVIGIFVVVGCVLFLIGHQGPVAIGEIFELLGGCGGIAAGVIVAVTRGRQATTVVAGGSRSAMGTALTKAGNRLAKTKT